MSASPSDAQSDAKLGELVWPTMDVDPANVQGIDGTSPGLRNNFWHENLYGPFPILFSEHVHDRVGIRNKAGEIVWLDELRELSIRFPASRDAVVLRMSMSAAKGGGGIALQGLVRDPSVVARLDQNLHDAYHTVSSRRVGEHPGEDYSWVFDRSIAVLPRPKKRPTATQVAKP